MTHLLDMPLEIRNMIYKFCLISNKVIIPYSLSTGYGIENEDAETCNKEQDESTPTSSNAIKSGLGLGLLAASRMISEEAKVVYYGGNRWQISNDTLYHDDETAYKDPELIKDLWKKNLQHFRHIDLCFSAWDRHALDAKRLERLREMALAKSCPVSKENRKGLEHEDLVQGVCIACARKLDLLYRMQLKTLEVDLEDCVCPAFCCSLTQVLMLEKSLMQPWQRVKEEDEDKIKDIYRAKVLLYESEYLDAMAFRHPKPPASLHNMMVRFRDLGFKDDFSLAHRLGFGCERCPMRNGICDTASCVWEKDPSLWESS